MNYTLKDANRIRVGDTLTLKDGSKHKAMKDICGNLSCIFCSYAKHDICNKVQCDGFNFHFKQIK